MHKLTVFTVVLSIVVVVVVAEVLFNNYLSDVNEGQVSILTSQSDAHPSLVRGTAVKNEEEVEETPRSVTIEGASLEELLAEEKGFEVSDDEEIDLDALLKDEEGIDIEILELEGEDIDDDAIKRAGFAGAGLVSASFDGNIFQTVDVTDLGLNVKKEYVASNSQVFGAIYRFSVDQTRQNELYRVLRERAAFGSAVEVNETNTFGDNSYYMNDSRRETTAFLVIRSGSKFYGFAYPKKNHQYFKQLALSL